MEEATQLLLQASEELPTSKWIEVVGIKRENGDPLEFVDHAYLKGIYDDSSPLLVCLKAAQVGFSTMAIVKTIRIAHKQKMGIIYILPTADMVEKFVGSKVNRISSQNPILSLWIKDKDKITEKQIGESYIFYSGAQTDRSAIMVSADLLVSDEHDKSPQLILETYDSRLQHSKYKYKWVFSNPTSPDFGVDKYWKLSDQKKWHVAHSCGKQFVLDEHCIDYDTQVFRCPTCKKEITDDERRCGFWKATAMGEWSGYWIPLWISPLVSAKVICDHKKTKTAEYFSNFVAGLPYTGTGNKVSAQTIINCLEPKVNSQQSRIIIGVDTGLPIHFVCANKEGFFYYGKCSDPKIKDPYLELEALLNRWPSSIMIADQGGDLIGIRNLQSKFPGRVFLVWYRQDRKSPTLIQWGEGGEYGKVIVDRNRTIQQFIDEMTDKRWKYNGTEADWHEVITHWLNIYREWEYDESGLLDKEKGFKWNRTGPDHFVHASIYARVGLDKFQDQMAQVVGDDLLDGLPYGRIY